MRNGKPRRTGMLIESRKKQPAPFVNPINPSNWRPPSINRPSPKSNATLKALRGLFNK